MGLEVHWIAGRVGLVYIYLQKVDIVCLLLGAYKVLWCTIFLLYYTFSPFTFRAFIHFEKFGGQDFDVKGLT